MLAHGHGDPGRREEEQDDQTAKLTKHESPERDVARFGQAIRP